MTKNGEFKIEKGVPFPTIGNGRTAYPLETMRVGESFLIKCEPKASKARQTNALNAASHLRHWRDACKTWRFTTRVVDGGVRVWRTA